MSRGLSWPGNSDTGEQGLGQKELGTPQPGLDPISSSAAHSLYKQALSPCASVSSPVKWVS